MIKSVSLAIGKVYSAIFNHIHLAVCGLFMKKRVEQVSELVRREVGKIFLREIPLPRDCLITVTRVEAVPDLREAKIFLTIFPAEKSAETMKFLQRSIGKIQFLLNRRLSMRPLPKISFKIDDIEKQAEKIDYLLDELEKGHIK